MSLHSKDQCHCSSRCERLGKFEGRVDKCANPISTTMESVLELGLETVVSRDVLQSRLTSKEGEAASDAEARKKFEVEHCDANLK